MADHWRSSWYRVRKDAVHLPHVIEWIDDDRIRRQRGFPSRTAALQFKRLKDAQLNSWLTPDRDASWEELVQEFFAAASSSGVRHQHEVAAILDRFCEFAKPGSSRAVTPGICDAYFANRARQTRKRRRGNKIVEEPLSPATLAKEWRILHAVFELCVRRRLLPANPLETVRRPKLIHTPKRVPRTTDWVELLRALERPDLLVRDVQGWHLLILLAVVTGSRQQAILRLTWDRVKLGGADTGNVGLLEIFESKTRSVVLRGVPPEVNERLAARLTDLPEGCKHVFPHFATFQRKAWNRISSKAGYAFSFHALRAAGGTREALASTQSAGAAFLHHSNPRVFAQHYADHERIARAVASRPDLLPADLPAFPAYVAPETLAIVGRRPRSAAPSARSPRTDSPSGSSAARSGR